MNVDRRLSPREASVGEHGGLGGFARLLLLLSGIAWLSGIGTAIAYQMRLEREPGSTGANPGTWPDRSILSRTPNRVTLVMAAHPRCPCTRAGLDSLAVVLTHARDRVDAYVLFALPEGMEDQWARTWTWEKAASIPGVAPVLDRDGRESARFGLSTSGHALLYDAQGVLKFSGGINPARGTTGPSAGLDSVLSAVRTGVASYPKTPIYGCPLYDRTKEKP